MKSKKYIAGMSLALLLALASCGPEKGSSSEPIPSDPTSSEENPSSDPISTPPSSTESEDDDPDVSGGTFIDNSKSFKNALKKDYSNMTVYSYQGYGEGEEENYIYYYNDYQIVYDPTSNSYLYYHDYEGENYLYFSPDHQGGPEAWLNKGYMDADLSIWNTYFHMPTLINNVSEDDVYFVAGYYVVKTQDIIDRLSATAFQYAWFNNPTYLYFSLNSEGYINQIVGIDNPDRDDSPLFMLKFLYIGETTFYQANLPTAPNEDNVIPYWQYKGWDGPWVDIYPTALTISHTKSGDEDHDIVLDIEDYDPVSYVVDPDNYNTFEYPSWHSTNEEVATVGYPFKASNTKSIMAMGEGECEIYATIPGENGTVVESNHLKVKVNPMKEQNLEGMVYDLSFVDYDKEKGSLTVLNEAGNAPVKATGAKLMVNDGKNSDYLYEKGEKALLFEAGTQGGGQPYALFDFDDQQVSSISFKYGLFWSNDRLNLDWLHGASIETSNDGETWESIDILDEVKENISDKYAKVLERSFAPASMVRINFVSNYIGKTIRPSMTSLQFMANEDCHMHVYAPHVDTTGINLTVDDSTIYVGDKTQATAVIVPSDASNKKVAYSSSDESVATIDKNGVITALKEGTTVIKATQDEIVSNEITLTVAPRPNVDAKYVGKWIAEDFKGYFEINAEDLTHIHFALDEELDNKEFDLLLVEVDGRTHTFKDENGNSAVINFGSDVTLFKNGTNLDGYAPSKNQVEFEKYVPSTGIKIEATNKTLYLGSSDASLTKTTLKAVVSPTGATASSVVWSHTTEGIVDIEEKGNTIELTAKGIGTVTFYCFNDEGKMASVTIKVVAPVYSDTLSIADSEGSAIPENALNLNNGSTFKLQALLDPKATEKNVEWISSDSSVASVSSEGLVTAKKAGTATISVNYHGLSQSITVTVTGDSAVYHSGAWTGLDYNSTPITWTVSSDGNTAVLAFTDYDDVDHEYHFTLDGASSDSKNIVFVYDEDSSVIATMYANPWGASTTSCNLTIDDEEGVINNYETLFIDENGADLTR